MFQKNIITILFALFFSTVFAAEEAESEAMNKKMKDKIQICVSCHGKQGETIMPVYPILAGQNFYYTYVQLKDLKSGYRKNEIMAAMVQDLEKDEMKLLASHFSEQTWPETKHNPMRKNQALQKWLLMPVNVCNVIVVGLRAKVEILDCLDKTMNT